MTVDVDKLSKSEKAYNYVRQAIRLRQFEPGHRLVLSQLADDLGMSVVPVREAIRQLEAEGLVEYETNVGARVTDQNMALYFETMETVALLEGYATSLSAPHLAADDLAQAREINDQMRDSLDNFIPATFTGLNKQFHQVIFGRCENQRLVQLVLTEWERLDHFRDSTFRYVPERARTSVVEHDQLILLIEAGADPGYVEQVARAHRVATSDSYREQLINTGVTTHD